MGLVTSMNVMERAAWAASAEVSWATGWRTPIYSEPPGLDKDSRGLWAKAELSEIQTAIIANPLMYASQFWRDIAGWIAETVGAGVGTVVDGAIGGAIGATRPGKSAFPWTAIVIGLGVVYLFRNGKR